MVILACLKRLSNHCVNFVGIGVMGLQGHQSQVDSGCMYASFFVFLLTKRLRVQGT